MLFVEEEEEDNIFEDSIEDVKEVKDNLISRNNILNIENCIEKAVKKNSSGNIIRVGRSKSTKVNQSKRKESLKPKRNKNNTDLNLKLPRRKKSKKFHFVQRLKVESSRRLNKSSMNSLNSITERFKGIGRRKDFMNKTKALRKSERCIKKFSMRNLPKTEFRYKEVKGKTFNNNELRREETDLTNIEKKLKVLTTKEDTNFLDVSEE